MTFDPKYNLTPRILKALSQIEIVRHDMGDLPVTATLISSLRESAKLSSIHYSTAIEGNLLSEIEVQKVIQNQEHFPNRKKDEDEVKNYYKALAYTESVAQSNSPLREDHARTLHGLSFLGRLTPNPYRDGQNVIRNGKLVVYIPPKAEDVPLLMKDLFAWITQALDQNIPIPVIAGIAHYQFVTIHPYYDGNGRTARLLTTLILHKYGYDLKGIYSLEEYYAKNLQGYYDALTVGDDEDYYEGHRSTADITGFLEYFLQGMAKAFEAVRHKAKESGKPGIIDQSHKLRDLSPQMRQALKLFISSREISTRDIANYFQYSDRQARYLCKKWIEAGFLEIANPADKGRTYRLAATYEALIQF